MSLLAERLAWQSRGVCRTNPQMWTDLATAPLARHMCLHHCKVLAECREWAEQHDWDAVVVAGVQWLSVDRHAQPQVAKVQRERLCADCIGDGCVECGATIPESRGRNALTCSPACGKRRMNRNSPTPVTRGRRRRCVVCGTRVPPAVPVQQPFCSRPLCHEVFHARHSGAITARVREAATV